MRSVVPTGVTPSAPRPLRRIATELFNTDRAVYFLGLVLHLDIEQEEYIGPLTDQAGIRVLLHDQGSMIFPFEEGFSVSPGISTSVGIKKVRKAFQICDFAVPWPNYLLLLFSGTSIYKYLLGPVLKARQALTFLKEYFQAYNLTSCSRNYL